MVNLKKWKNIYLAILFLLSLKGLSYSQQGISFDVSSFKSGKRGEISLNGTWDFLPVEWEKKDSLPPVDANWQKIRVPSWWEKENKDWAKYDVAWFRKVFSLSGDLKEKEVVIHFNRVTYQCWIYLNGKLVGEHFDGFTPFEINLTGQMKKGANEILVKVMNWSAAVDPSINFQASKEERPKDWPSKIIAPRGWPGITPQAGISEDVKLMIRSKVYIDDVFIETSFREKRIDIEIVLKNNDMDRHTVKLVGEVERSNLSFKEEVDLEPHSSKTVKTGCKWEKPILWWPQSPHLYKLKTELVEERQSIDKREDPFGFREFWIEGNQFKLNGYKIKLFGASAHWDLYGYQGMANFYPECGIKDTDYLPNLEKAKENLRILKERNINCIRMEGQPLSVYTLQAADELGMLIMDSSPLCLGIGQYGTAEHGGEDSIYWKVYWKNAEIQIKEWIRVRRNHPAVIVWAAENELLCWIGDKRKLDPNERAAVAAGEIKEWIKSVDPARPVIYYADGDVGGRAEIISFHYPFWADYHTHLPDFHYWPERVMKEKNGMCGYRGFGQVNLSEKPLCITEFCFTGGHGGALSLIGRRHSAKECRQAIGAITRMIIEAYRYCDIAGIFPYSILYQPMIPYLRTSFTPQVVFVKEYNKNFYAGSKICRTITVYNDILEKSKLTLKWYTQFNGKIYQSGNISAKLSPSEYRREKLILNVPNVTERKNLKFILKLYTKRKLVFEDEKNYSVFPENLPAEIIKKINESKIALFSADKNTKERLEELGISFVDLSKEPIQEFNLLIVGENSLAKFQRGYSVEQVKTYLREGGKILCLYQGGGKVDWFDSELSFRWNRDWKYSICFPFPSKENHPVFNNIKMCKLEDRVEKVFDNDLSFWGKDDIISHHVVIFFQPSEKFNEIAQVSVDSGIGSRACLVEAKEGKGTCLFSQFNLIGGLNEEPAARQLLINLIRYLINKKIIWQ